MTLLIGRSRPPLPSGWAGSNAVLWNERGALALPGVTPMVGAATNSLWYCLHKGVFT